MPTDALFDANIGLLEDDYAQFPRFVQQNNSISYSRFDQKLLRRVNLFSLPEDFEFDTLQEALDRIIKTLPAIKRIFAQPITHIKTMSEILPVESVRVINNETIVHASSHSEHWENITGEGLKPRKLLTQDNQDNYAIYENIIFTKAVDMILSFVGKNIRLINNILYANRDLKFNLLERENHMMYFLAIGKFHAGYVRDYAKYRTVAESCMDKLLFIDRVIRARLNSPVYKHCKRQTAALDLKKTNVFRMDKEYHKIYVLLKWFSEGTTERKDSSGSKSNGFGKGYRLFCSLLSVFAAGHFNFTFPEDRPIDFDKLNAECTFEAWRLRLETVECAGSKALRFTVTKDTPYSVILLSTADISSGEQELELFKKHWAADEYLLAASFEDEKAPVYLSLYDIDSFRRIQQIILRAMIYSDQTRDMCPFCGQPLTKDGEALRCESCRTQITAESCPDTGERYFVTGIKNFSFPNDTPRESKRLEKLSQELRRQSQMHFRNITALASNGDPVCPKCGRIHSKQTY